MDVAAPLDAETCYRAYETRDARFDGRFFVAVRTTGIFCRPVCPARTPKRRNVEFHASAAAAFAAGFRPCLRCRPERAPRAFDAQSAGSSLVAHALEAIESGALDTGNLGDLAARIGVTDRHLRRLFAEHLGATPVEVAQARRALFARQLIEETRLPMTEVAFAAGYSSVRRFNAAIAAAYGQAPGAMRRALPDAAIGEGAGAIRLRLGTLDGPGFDRLLAFYRARLFAGVETVEGLRYARAIGTGDGAGWFGVEQSGAHAMLAVRTPDPRSLPRIVARVRRMFDLSGPHARIAAHLRGDPLLAPALAEGAPRVPCAWDPFELAVRAILGQQVSVAAATTLAGRLTRRFGLPFEGPGGIDRLFPAGAVLAGLAVEDLASLGIVRARAASIIALARHVEATPGWRDRYTGLEACEAGLTALPGIGPWTAQYVAMRGFGEPDAFPAADLGLLKAARALGIADTPRELARHAERWRPWRSYAAQALWNYNPRDAA
jgi:AraC family transcriptional regulator of adaptative response / DNA-3-methyladenine glycosylase II